MIFPGRRKKKSGQNGISKNDPGQGNLLQPSEVPQSDALTPDAQTDATPCETVPDTPLPPQDTNIENSLEMPAHSTDTPLDPIPDYLAQWIDPDGLDLTEEMERRLLEGTPKKRRPRRRRRHPGGQA